MSKNKEVGMNFHIKFFILYLGITVVAIITSLIFLSLKEENEVKGDALSLLTFCTNMVENMGDLGGDNYDWGSLPQSCLYGDRVIYFGVPSEQHN